MGAMGGSTARGELQPDGVASAERVGKQDLTLIVFQMK